MVLPQHQRALIIHLHQTGNFTHRQIAQQLNINRRTVDRVINLWQESGSTLSRSFARPPTNRRILERGLRSVVRLSVADPQATAREKRDRHGGEALNASVRTMRRWQNCISIPAIPNINTSKEKAALSLGQAVCPLECCRLGKSEFAWMS